MIRSGSVIRFALLVASAVHAAPNPIPIEPRAVRTLSQGDVSSFKPYTLFSRAGYCKTSQTSNWSCKPCKDLPEFEVFQTGGDGTDSPSWFVGYYPPLDTVIVSHQGTNSSDPVSYFTDIDILQQQLDPRLFPGVGGGPWVHEGFLGKHDESALDILDAVNRVLDAKPSTTKVAVTGHSLGAAIATINGVFLSLHLPSDISIKVVGYASPRVGNGAWASLVDELVPDHHRINNNHDLVGILPGRHFGYSHAAGEIHITGTKWADCPGRDSTAMSCTIATVPNILLGKAADHRGPYDGVTLSHHECD
jgi:hypothetical protein